MNTREEIHKNDSLFRPAEIKRTARPQGVTKVTKSNPTFQKKKSPVGRLVHICFRQ